MILKTEIFINDNLVEMKREYIGHIDQEGNEVITGTIDTPNIEYTTEVSEPTQLDLIQQAVEKSNNELRQEGADTAILELIKKGIL